MKITGARANNRKRLFEVDTPRGSMTFPYREARPIPSAADRVAEVFVDAELGNEAVTFRLVSGAEGSIHIDAILEWNEDPAVLADLLLYKLSVAASERFAGSPLSVRQVAQRLGTSPTQVYRLLDPANSTKSLHQLIELLSVLGADVDVEVTERAPSRRPRR